MRKNTHPHYVIAFEGIDGTGKSTVCREVVQAFDAAAEHTEAPFLGDQAITRIQRELRRALHNDTDLGVLMEKRMGGAVQVENIPYPNPTNAINRAAFEDLHGIDLGSYLYVLSALFKDKVIEAVLPYLHVVCDRYLYSLIAKHKALGTSYDMINYGALDIVKPDLFIQLKVEEEKRLERIRARGNPNLIDLIPNAPGTRHWQIERTLELFGPRVIDTTEMTPAEIAALVMRDVASLPRA